MKDMIKFDFKSSVSIIGSRNSGKTRLALELKTKLNNVLYVPNEKDISFEKITSLLENEYSYVIFDDVLTFLEDFEKDFIIGYCQKRNIIIINITTLSEELLLLPNIIVLDDNKVILEGKKEEVLANEKLFSTLGIKRPFVVQLSGELKDYSVINQLYFDNEELVDELWK